MRAPLVDASWLSVSSSSVSFACSVTTAILLFIILILCLNCMWEQRSDFGLKEELRSNCINKVSTHFVGSLSFSLCSETPMNVKYIVNGSANSIFFSVNSNNLIVLREMKKKNEFHRRLLSRRSSPVQSLICNVSWLSHTNKII